MWIERSISDILAKAAQFPVVVLAGARQAGKTSLVRRLFPKADYASFDIPRDADAARLDFAGFLSRHREPLIIDEVQYVPETFRRLKAVVDQDRLSGRFLLTGSHDFSLGWPQTPPRAGFRSWRPAARSSCWSHTTAALAND